MVAGVRLAGRAWCVSSGWPGGCVGWDVLA